MTRITIALAAMLALAPITASLAEEAPASPAARAERAGRGQPLTLEEFVQRATASAERRFRRLDANADGVLSIEERRAPRRPRAD